MVLLAKGNELELSCFVTSINSNYTWQLLPPTTIGIIQSKQTPTKSNKAQLTPCFNGFWFNSTHTP